METLKHGFLGLLPPLLLSLVTQVTEGAHLA